MNVGPRRPLILDLDYTLLHLEARPGAIEVPGRTRSAYLAPETFEALAELRERFEVVLATARSWAGTREVVEGLASRGVEVYGTVLEDGALLGKPGAERPLEPSRRWEPLRDALTGLSGCPPFEWQGDFRACLVARAASREEAEELRFRLGAEALRLDPTLRLFRDGRKVYVTGMGADKWTGLVVLLGERTARAVGIGDGLNDLVWLSRVSLPATLAGAAPEVADLVAAQAGLISDEPGHAGIAQVLRRVGRLSLAASPTG
jgi:hydroxymethylpyrimidine pyrophosphatase-like HAD family hydrolase